MSINNLQYLDKPEHWDELAARIRRAGICGLDTEFYGLNVRKESPVGKAKVHVWSLALRSQRESPLGFHIARGWTLPAEALSSFYGLKGVLEDPGITKCVHNQSADDHTLHNEGIDIKGCINTLNLARWVWPGLVNDGFFGLKNLMAVKLRREPVAEFRDVVGWTKTESVTTPKTVKGTVCSCGAPGCRRRKGHTKTTSFVTKFVTKDVKTKGEYPLESIVPGHERWDLLVRYAAEDAIAALELEELMRQTPNPAPWPYGDLRPEFNQAVDNDVVIMERNGFHVDTEWCRGKAAVAEADELQELEWLNKWWEKNRLEGDGNKVWSSPKQLLELFDRLGFPRSPIWKKGRVKLNGTAKLDATALDWIAKAHPPARGVITHLLKLKKIRANAKYLTKLRDCGGYVNVICGPAGDNDDRNGAVTGRLGIKGVIEAQQLPAAEDKDIYQIRRAIIAGGGGEHTDSGGLHCA